MSAVYILGTIGSVVSVVATTAFVIGYLSLAPWYRTSIGKSLMMSKTWICAVAWYALLNSTGAISDGAIEIVRAAIWMSLPVVSVYTLWALLIRNQIAHRLDLAASRERKEPCGNRRD